MTRILLIAALIAAALAFDRRPAQADEKPWCMNIEGSERCYFDTAEQCGRAASAGSRGLCHQNPWYRGPQPRQEAPRRPRH
jgi:hypothetical protein